MRTFKLYWNTSWDFRTDELPLTNQQLKLALLLNDPTNYYKDLSVTLSYNKIKDIFENKDYQLSLTDLERYIDSKDYLYFLNHSDIDLSRGISSQKNKYNNVLIDLNNQIIPDWAFSDFSISEIFKIRKLYKNLDSSIIDDNMGKIASFKKDFEDYFGNEYTYLTLKKLLKIYIDGVLLYLYKDEILTYSEILNKYDKENEF